MAGKGREKEGKKHRCERQTSMGWLLFLAPQAGTRPATQACALTRNGTSDPLLWEGTLNQQSHVGQDYSRVLVFSMFPFSWGRWQLKEKNVRGEYAVKQDGRRDTV